MPELDGAVAEAEPGLDLGDPGGEIESGVEGAEGEGLAADTSVEADAAAGAEASGQAAERTTEPGLEKLPKQYAGDKFVKGLYFSNQKLVQAFPGGVNEAVQLKQNVEALGGAEGLKQFEVERQGWQQTDRHFAEGNPAVLEDIAAQSPEGFVKLMGPALDKLQQVDPEAYNHSLGKIFWNTLTQSGAINELSGLEEALARGDVAAATQKLAKVGEFLRTINGYASKIPEKKGPDPERQKFLAEKTAFEQTKQTEFRNGVLGETRQYALGKIEAQLTKEFSTRNASLVKLKTSDPESYNILVRNCYQALNEKLGADKDAFKRFSGALTSGKRDDALRLARGRIDAAFSEAVSKTYKAFYRVAGGKAPAAAAAAGAAAVGGVARPANGTVKLTKVPAPEVLDKTRMYREFGKDKTDSMIFNGRGYLKSKPALYDWN